MGGIEEISRVGGTQLDGSPWNPPLGDVIEAIRDGQSYFVVTPVEALLVSVYIDAAGERRLNAGSDEDGCEAPASWRGALSRAARA